MRTAYLRTLVCVHCGAPRVHDAEWRAHHGVRAPEAFCALCEEGLSTVQRAAALARAQQVGWCAPEAPELHTCGPHTIDTSTGVCLIPHRYLYWAHPLTDAHTRAQHSARALRYTPEREARNPSVDSLLVHWLATRAAAPPVVLMERLNSASERRATMRLSLADERKEADALALPCDDARGVEVDAEPTWRDARAYTKPTGVTRFAACAACDATMFHDADFRSRYGLACEPPGAPDRDACPRACVLCRGVMTTAEQNAVRAWCAAHNGVRARSDMEAVSLAPVSVSRGPNAPPATRARQGAWLMRWATAVRDAWTNLAQEAMDARHGDGAAAAQ